MDHVAILSRRLKLIPKILSGEKGIESRWYKARFAPWGKIGRGDYVYFRDSGGPVEIKAKVKRVLQFDNFSKEKLDWVIDKYGGVGGICFSSKESAYDFARGKRYYILIFLESVERVNPFDVDKTGFGNATAWMCVGDIDKVKLKK